MVLADTDMIKTDTYRYRPKISANQYIGLSLRPTDRPTNRQTYTLKYRAAIAANKNNNITNINQFEHINSLRTDIAKWRNSLQTHQHSDF